MNEIANKAAYYARIAKYSLDEFTRIYLGAKDTAPTTDNEGQPLQEGALYFNTVSKILFVWDGTNWLSIYDDEIYLGGFSVAPTLNNQGLPLQIGNLYWNTGSNNLWAYNGTTWLKTNFNETTPFLSTGSTTARTLANRFADVFNVKDFGAVGDYNPSTGIGADDTAAIQTALDSAAASPHGAGIYFPRGIYKITNTIQVKSNYTGFFCDAFGSAGIQLTNFSVPCAVLVKNPASGNGIFAFSMQNIVINRSPSSTLQKGIILEACSNTHISDIEIGGFPTGMEIRGGVNCHYTAIRLNDFGSTNTDSTGLLEINASTYVPSPVFFTHMFANSMIAGSAYSIKITAGDYFGFVNCYLGAGREGDVLIDAGTLYGAYDAQFDNCYFDHSLPGLNMTGAAVEVRGGNSQGIKLTDCKFNPWGVGLKIDQPIYTIIQVTGCLFNRCNKAIEMTSNANAASLAFTGNKLNGCGMYTGNSNIIDIKDCGQITITGNDITSNYADWDFFGQLPGVKKIIGIGAGATIDNVSIVGNVMQGFAFGGVSFVDFENLGTVGRLAVTGNTSNNATNTIVGSIIGNQENANPLSLDWYEEGVFTPILSFNSGSTLITFSDRQGNFTRIGNRVVFDIYIALTSKGTSTGAVGIGGIPFPLAPSATARANASVSIQRIDGIGTANVDAVFPSTAGMKLVYINGTGDPVDLTDANFRNNTQFWISGTYQVA
jgi:hypothetical protein